ASVTEPMIEVQAGDLMTIMYTSGTTGLPKGIMHTHFTRAMYAGLMSASWRMSPESIVLQTGAIVFNGAMLTLLPGLYCGATYILHKHRADAVRKAGSVGVPPPFYDMRIVDEEGRDCAPGQVGEIIGRGPITMAGYVNRDDLTAQTIRNGWVHTGDLGHVDDEGYLYLVDRKKDMIDSGGVKVYPKDIEEIAV